MINLILFIDLLKDWAEFGFDEPSPRQIQFLKIREKHLETNKEKVYILTCYFQLASTFSGDGGAIYCSFNGQFLVELSFFVNCTASHYGGAIYQANSECIINKCCSICCFSTNNIGYGQFIYSKTSLNSDMKNYILDCSVAFSASDEYSLYVEELSLNNGNISVQQSNISHNSLTYTPGIKSDPNAQSVTKYCSFYQNMASINYLINHIQSNTQYYIEYSNIINNTIKTCLLRALGRTLLQYCCIIENYYDILFEGSIYLI